jgi:hypothetical protein
VSTRRYSARVRLPTVSTTMSKHCSVRVKSSRVVDDPGAGRPGRVPVWPSPGQRSRAADPGSGPVRVSRAPAAPPTGQPRRVHTPRGRRSVRP